MAGFFGIPLQLSLRTVLRSYNPTTTNGTYWNAPRLSWFKDVNITASTLSSRSVLIWDGSKWVNNNLQDTTYEFINIDGGSVQENYSGIGEQIDGGFSTTIF
jgi:hypothetical protein